MSSLFGVALSSLDITDSMMPGYDWSKPFWDRPKLPRTKPHPFVQGFMLAMLEDWPFKCINDITERTYVQMIRECAYYFQFCDDALGELSFLYDVPMPALGKAFWESRSGGFGFAIKDWPYADQLHHVATTRFYPVWVIEHESGEFEGQVDYTWEDPDADFTFDFT